MNDRLTKPVRRSIVHYAKKYDWPLSLYKFLWDYPLISYEITWDEDNLPDDAEEALEAALEYYRIHTKYFAEPALKWKNIAKRRRTSVNYIVEVLKNKKSIQEASTWSRYSSTEVAQDIFRLREIFMNDRGCFLIFALGPKMYQSYMNTIYEKYNIKTGKFAPCSGAPTYPICIDMFDNAKSYLPRLLNLPILQLGGFSSDASAITKWGFGLRNIGDVLSLKPSEVMDGEEWQVDPKAVKELDRYGISVDEEEDQWEVNGSPFKISAYCKVKHIKPNQKDYYSLMYDLKGPCNIYGSAACEDAITLPFITPYSISEKQFMLNKELMVGYLDEVKQYRYQTLVDAERREYERQHRYDEKIEKQKASTRYQHSTYQLVTDPISLIGTNCCHESHIRRTVDMDENTYDTLRNVTRPIYLSEWGSYGTDGRPRIQEVFLPWYKRNYWG